MIVNAKIPLLLLADNLEKLQNCQVLPWRIICVKIKVTGFQHSY